MITGCLSPLSHFFSANERTNEIARTEKRRLMNRRLPETAGVNITSFFDWLMEESSFCGTTSSQHKRLKIDEVILGAICIVVGVVVVVAVVRRVVRICVVVNCFADHVVLIEFK